MESSILKRAEEFILEKMKRKRWQKIVAVLAAFVILVTVWILLKPATATTKKTYCELEEHTHIEECYERTLICEKAGTEDDSTGGSTSGGSSEDSDSEDSSSDEESGDSDTENSDTTEPGTSTEGNDTTDGTNSGTSTEGGNQSGTTNPEETGGSTSDKDGASTDTSGTPEGGDTSSGGTENSGGSSDTSSPAGGSSVGGDSSTGGESSGGGDTSTGGDVSGGASSGGESAPAPSVDVAPSGDVAPVDGGVSSLYNIPATDSKQFVQVSLAHYLSDGTQGTEAESGTVGNTGAGDVMSGDGQVGGELPAGMEEEHVHTDDCYEKKLTCELEEHTHEAICYIDPALPQEDKDRILYAASLIDALPEHEEIMEILAGYEESGDEEGYQSYFQEIAEQALRAYACFEDLGVLQQYIRNKEKVLMLSNLWETMTLDIPDGKSLTVKGINIASWSMNSTGVILFATQIPNDTNFSFWYAFYLTPDEDEKVYQITRIDGIGAAQGGKKPPTNGLILLIHEESHKEVCSTTKVGDYVELDFDYRNCLDGVKNEGYGTVTIGSDYKDPEAKEVRNNELPTIPAASTADLIEINLYDYTYESGDLHINKKYNMTFKESYPYPGFNNPARGSSDMGTNQNFGDLIVSDIDVSEAKVNDKEIANGINERYLNNREPYKGAASSGNLPISVQLDVMSKELQDGYPALIDGTSLAYLFGGEEVSYVKRQNQDGLDGLFQYNEKTGWYTFNSCANHAQFNAEENRFDLYNQVISSNFGIYPFGNFLPFNDIQQAMQASAINKDYYQKMVNDTAYKLQNETDEGHKKEYKRLKDGLEDYIRKMDEKKGENNWTGADVVNDVFEGLASTSWSDIGGFEPVTDNDIDYIYSIDFDDPTNFYFGMSMELDFIQPKDGIVIPPSAEGNGNASNMVFRFVGDDDVWVYIDGKLILDLSGIHRDVGGEIDFVNGEVSYYKLDRSYYKPAQKEGNVDLNVDPVKTVKFSELFSPDQLNEKGTLKDNSTHSMNFYYMERGSGSGVCRMEFNFPLLEKNSFAVGKELSVNNVEVEDLLGHPDFKFQVLEAEKQPDGTMVKPAPDQEKFFITAGMEYSVYREGTVCQNKEEGHVHTANCTLEVTIGEGKKKTYADSGETRLVDENHIFRLKAGEYAIFSGISVVNNGYYVRELLESDLFEQYGEISVSGEAATEHNSISIGKESFEGVESGIKNILEGDTIFYFDNKVDVTKLSELSITKEVDGSEYSKQNEEFLFKVKLGENWLEVGTPYTVSRAVSGGGVELSSGSAIKYLNCGEAHEHASSCYIGVISLKHGETATLEKILAGTEYWIQEIESEGYAVTYKIASPIPSVTDENNKYIPRIVIVDGKQDHVEGITSVKYKPIQIIVVNRESGEVSPPTEIPLTIKKELRNSDGKEHIYRFKVEKVADFEGTPFEEGTTTNDILSNCYELEIKIPAEGETNGEAILHLEYSSDDFPDLKKGESTFRYFKITESVPEDSEEASPEAAATTIFDKTVYVMELKITRTDRKEIKVEYSRIHQGDGEGNWTVEECDGEFPFTFTNEIQSDLIIGKWVNGNIAENEEFTFTVTLSGSAITTEEMSFPYTTGKIESLLETGAENDHSSSITFASSIGTATLRSGEYFKLYGLPYGISWRVEEQEPENGQKYHISYLLNSHLWGKTDALYATERIEESVASGALLLPEVTGEAIDNAVTFVNTTSYSLPETGSFHTKLLYTLAGVSLVLVACLLYRKKFKERRI